MKAYLIFTDGTTLWWLRLLRRGFRHIAVLVCDGGRCALLDPVWGRVEVRLFGRAEARRLLDFCRARGGRVVAAEVRGGGVRLFGLAPFSCVSFAKRVIGVEGAFVWTPWRLYKMLFSGGGACIIAKKEQEISDEQEQSRKEDKGFHNLRRRAGHIEKKYSRGGALV